MSTLQLAERALIGMQLKGVERLLKATHPDMTGYYVKLKPNGQVIVVVTSGGEVCPQLIEAYNL